ncbi:MAG: hypothetical protein GXP00_08615 [Alphaproteobacteria bacterium]|nr:hypothetical protein [Alphaproteobacteria bacterium]
MNKKYIFLLPAITFLTSGCASIMSGTDQDIAIHTNPEGAECILTRENQQLRKVTTPDNVRVSKLKHDIYVKCSMEGFHDSTAHVNSGTQGSTFGNILLGGGIGWAIDSARGADNKYADVVTVTMVPLTQVAPESIVVGADGTMLKKSEADALKAEEIKKKKEAENAVSTENMKADSDVEVADDVVSPETDTKSEENP